MAGRGDPARQRAGKRPARTPDRAGRKREGQDRGASSIELVLLAPLVILSILLVGQFAMWYQARHVAIAAAQAGARVARDTAQGLPWAGPAITAAQGYARQLGGSLLQGTSAHVVGSGNVRGVEVEGLAPSIIPIPGLTFRIDETSQGPTECFRPSGDPAQCTGS
ncbi:MAG TPA: TadE family protein [Streptosporangiaceae bacterium]